ncbi:IE-2 [Dione juno nucleopolyhedrovirus]|uniref:IE-2 n=1 Tax=Dione juno nucleopolyhedrovirus TaxID=2594175 RepID=A0AAE6H327_9ABAC|nr:IE-2 [Dione juno nucleopolyhedrovirus]QDL57008.1 IE-2 [Dione juno nucleopolyhedrovirus]
MARRRLTYLPLSPPPPPSLSSPPPPSNNVAPPRRRRRSPPRILRRRISSPRLVSPPPPSPPEIVSLLNASPPTAFDSPQIINDEEILFEFDISDAFTPLQPQPLPQIDKALFCYICSCTYVDIQDYNSNFVTSSECHHAVCFKCYVNIMFDKSEYKCSICNKITRTCRAYNSSGYVELKVIGTMRNNQIIKRHWMELMKSNVSHETNAATKQIEHNIELTKLRASLLAAHHSNNMMKSDCQLMKQQLDVKNLELQRESEAKLELQKQNEMLLAANAALQKQMDEQNDDFRSKMFSFEHQHKMFLEKFNVK